MSEPFLGEIKIVGFNFAPRSWASCNGQLLPISQYTALFSLLGTIYGGDGRTTFALPDLRSRSPRGIGNGPGLDTVSPGARGGTVGHTLTTNNLPPHSHTMNLASSNEGEQTSPANNSLAVSDDRNYVTGAGTPMGSTGNTGNQQPVDHLPPYLGVNYVIALQGLYPSRS